MCSCVFDKLHIVSHTPAVSPDASIVKVNAFWVNTRSKASNYETEWLRFDV